MNFSAEKAHRKWACGELGCDERFMAALVALVLMLAAQVCPAAAAQRPAGRGHGGSDGAVAASQPKPGGVSLHASVPLPRARPAEAPAAAPHDPSAEKQMPGEGEQPAEQAAPAPPPVSACRLALTDQIAIAPSIPDIHGVGGCGGEDLVRLQAVVLPDKRLVNVKPAAILRCSMASAIADWIRTDITVLAARLGSTVSDLDNFDSFECRGRNRVVGAQLSEHGRANALDVRALKLANGQSISLTDRSVAREVRESVLQSACARFSTVLGPGSDWYHEDHIHLDLMERRNNYKICQWSVWDPMPPIAPLMPAERPEEAPPRVAELDKAKLEATEADAPKSAPPKSAAAEHGGHGSGATKKRR
jgi:hypothetical protein